MTLLRFEPRLFQAPEPRRRKKNSPPRQRTADFSEINAGLSPAAALDEAKRCFNCGVCNLCDNCFLFCPDLAISARPDKQGYEINYDYCKGCCICVEECPRGAISVEVQEMKKLLTGNSAISLRGDALPGRRSFRPTPSLPRPRSWRSCRRSVRTAGCTAKFIRVESEHSALACVAAASAAGARVFTATSSHGLAYMHEMLHWVSGTRLPVVMVNANRAIGAPWNIWCDHSDSLSQRDTGWIQLYCQSAQEALDTVIQAYRIAEEVLLPVMVLEDGFFLSHTSDTVDVPDQKTVDAFCRPSGPATNSRPTNPTPSTSWPTRLCSSPSSTKPRRPWSRRKK